MNVDVFEVFSGSERETRPANGGRRDPSRLKSSLAVVLSVVALLAMAFAAWTAFRALAEDAEEPCDAPAREEQELMAPWLLSHLNTALEGRQRDVVATSCAADPGAGAPYGVSAALVEQGELNRMANVLAEAGCALEPEELPRSCATTVDDVPVRVELRAAREDGEADLDEFVVTVLRARPASSA